LHRPLEVPFISGITAVSHYRSIALSRCGLMASWHYGMPHGYGYGHGHGYGHYIPRTTTFHVPPSLRTSNPNHPDSESAVRSLQSEVCSSQCRWRRKGQHPLEIPRDEFKHRHPTSLLPFPSFPSLPSLPCSSTFPYSSSFSRP
jgi:hypothetical protein